MGIAYNGTDDTLHRRFDTVHRKPQATGEIIAGADADDAQRNIAAGNCIDAQADHAIATDHDQVIVGSLRGTYARDGFVKAFTGEVPHRKTMRLPACAQHIQHLLGCLGAFAVVRCGVADYRDNRLPPTLVHSPTIRTPHHAGQWHATGPARAEATASGMMGTPVRTATRTSTSPL